MPGTKQAAHVTVPVSDSMSNIQQPRGKSCTTTTEHMADFSEQLNPDGATPTWRMYRNFTGNANRLVGSDTSRETLHKIMKVQQQDVN